MYVNSTVQSGMSSYYSIATPNNEYDNLEFYDRNEGTQSVRLWNKPCLPNHYTTQSTTAVRPAHNTISYTS